MKVLPNSIFFLHQLPHPAHRAWAKKADDKQIFLYRKLIRDNLSPEISANNFKSALGKIYSKIK